ncbi:Os1348 family RiPP precursor [Pseudomonas sp. 6D_7.1_Bac1]|uniref:Os1348 family RiPP precursor n=1 Tax=Pseudomonas sp. 6D_7.1_Bac1 TaxID=2971615 RepID=UPI0021C93E4E|nr:Os1348 family RiPP precursor [Pseudomonas sp. 6D_7.1_Bac1]MCU1750530.1 Os1348 family RiPP precursor [Pseudomonas sp. 6D_7.1_Bac1]
MSNKVNQQTLASVVGRAVLDPGFADALQNDPATAAKNVGVHLSADEIAAVKSINVANLTAASAGIRSNLGTRAVFDTQQQQARMD